jgi:hypothetical protein
MPVIADFAGGFTHEHESLRRHKCRIGICVLWGEAYHFFLRDRTPDAILRVLGSPPREYRLH